MPLIAIRTSAQAPEPARMEALLRDLSARVAGHLGKPESFVMTSFEGSVPMTFAGNSDEPSCYLELKSVGRLSAQTTAAISADLCAWITASIGVPPERTYIEFAAAEGTLWGWNGRTFG